MLQIKIVVINAGDVPPGGLEDFIAGVRGDLETQYRVNPELKKKLDEYIASGQPLPVRYHSSHKTAFEADVARVKLERKYAKKGRMIKRVNPKKPKKYHKGN